MPTAIALFSTILMSALMRMPNFTRSVNLRSALARGGNPMGSVVRHPCRSNRSKMVWHYDIHGHSPGASCEPHITTSAGTWLVVKSGPKTRLVYKCNYDTGVGILRHTCRTTIES
jgi:hypothetical protein